MKKTRKKPSRPATTRFLSCKSEQRILYNLNDSLQSARFRDVFHYRWEFLSRNEEYADFFREHCEPVNGYGKVFAKSRDSKQMFGLYYLIDPALSFKDIEKALSEVSKEERVVMIDWISQFVCCQNSGLFQAIPWCAIKGTEINCIVNDQHVVFYDGFRKIDAVNIGEMDFDEIELRVNIHAPLGEIKKDFSKLMSAWSKQQRKVVRRSQYQYELYLRMYDLAKQGRSHREIARELFPNIYNPASRDMSNNEELRDRVKKGIKEAKKLVNGDFLNIR